jgi:hypothetical protein
LPAFASASASRRPKSRVRVAHQPLLGDDVADHQAVGDGAQADRLARGGTEHTRAPVVAGGQDPVGGEEAPPRAMVGVHHVLAEQRPVREHVQRLQRA